jgi:hypothetical protein
MKTIRIAALLSSVAFTAMTTGCATVTGGTTQNVSVKTQKAAAEIAGADCVLTNSKGSYEITTPGSVKVHRAKDDLSVKCTKTGESIATTTVQSSTRKGAFVAGNLVMFGVVGSLIATPIDSTPIPMTLRFPLETRQSCCRVRTQECRLRRQHRRSGPIQRR